MTEPTPFQRATAHQAWADIAAAANISADDDPFRRECEGLVIEAMQAQASHDVVELTHEVGFRQQAERERDAAVDALKMASPSALNAGVRDPAAIVEYFRGDYRGMIEDNTELTEQRDAAVALLRKIPKETVESTDVAFDWWLMDVEALLNGLASTDE